MRKGVVMAWGSPDSKGKGNVVWGGKSPVPQPSSATQVVRKDSDPPVVEAEEKVPEVAKPTNVEE